MTYFNQHPNTLYRFGNNEQPILFQDLSRYADVLDQIKDNVSVYEEFTIIENMRADQISQRLYGTPNLHWTFYLLNDKLREQGWPLSEVDLLAECKKDFPNTALVTATDIISKQTNAVTGITKDRIIPGATITGQNSGVSGVVDHRHVELGLVVVKGTQAFTAGETAVLSSDTSVSMIITSVVEEHLSTHHWENASGTYVDLIGSNGIVDITGGASNVEITQIDNFRVVNNNLKTIKVLKRDVVGQVTSAIKAAIKS